MKSQMTRMVGVFGLLSFVLTLAACDGAKSSYSPTAPTSESSTTSSASGPTANNDPKPDPAPTTPTNPAPPAPPTSPPPPGGSEGPTPPPENVETGIAKCALSDVTVATAPGTINELLAIFVDSMAESVVVNNSSRPCSWAFASFEITNDNENFRSGQIKTDQDTDTLQPGVPKTFRVRTNRNAACQLDAGGGTNINPPHIPGAQPALYALYMNGRKCGDPVKTCPSVEPFLGDLRVDDAGDVVNVSVIPEFKSVTINGNDLVIEVIQTQGDGVAIRQTRISREQKGTRVSLGSFSKGNTATKYEVIFKVSDDQVQNCHSNKLEFTVPAKPAVNVCVGTSGQLVKASENLQTDVLQYSVKANLTGGVRGEMSSPNVPFVPVNDGYTLMGTLARPESGTSSITYKLKWLKGDEECGNTELTIVAPAKDKKLTCVDLNHQLVANLNLSNDGKSAQITAKSEWTGGPNTSTITFGSEAPQQYTRGTPHLQSTVYPRKAEAYTVTIKSHIAIEGGNCDDVEVVTIPPLEVPPPTCPDLNLQLSVVSVEYPVNQPDVAIVTVRLNWTGGQDAGTISRDNSAAQPILRGATASFTVERKAQDYDVNFKGEARLLQGTTCPITNKARIKAKELTCDQQYPARLEFVSGYAETRNGQTVVEATVFVQNVQDSAVGILWINGDASWLKDAKPAHRLCGPGGPVVLRFVSPNGAHSQAGGARYEVWKVTPESQVQTSSFTLVGSAPIRILPWR